MIEARNVMVKARRSAKARKQTRKNDGATVGYEAELWRMADALRGRMDAAEYKHVVLGLIVFKHISDALGNPHTRLVAEQSSGGSRRSTARGAHLKPRTALPDVITHICEREQRIER
jgi:hypothetical protein